MDNYEVNVLTRKGGWKKLPQEVIKNKSELKFNDTDYWRSGFCRIKFSIEA